MRVFHCEHCDGVVAFGARECPICGAALGFLSDEGRIRELVPDDDDPAVFRVAGRDDALWRCLNAAWECNWTVAAGGNAVWCRSCRLTRGRPDDARPAAMAAWMTAEAAKRRLVAQLDALGLPIDARSPQIPDGLAFDLVHVPGEGGVTGHLDGIVTLDLAETDDRHRDDLRRQLDETFRTVIGHLRHEIGHHYWNRIIRGSEHLDESRRLFGDERTDYRAAIETYYSTTTAWDTDQYVTAYAASHPLEDWAECFAHYLHILDGVDTATAHGLLAAGVDGSARGVAITHADVASLELTDILGAWRPIAAGVNAVAESLGAPVVYPIDPSGHVVDKLEFVHRLVVGHASRDRISSAP